jgi:SOS response regulatory protein OraA/RecX
MRDHSEQELRRKLAAPVMSKNGPELLTNARGAIAFAAPAGDELADKTVIVEITVFDLRARPWNRRCANAISTG